ncbi:MAG: DinB family protein [Micromonosporaceae bacterium]|nr:DinB family protein [Micromonosporaceae bacterium]
MLEAWLDYQRNTLLSKCAGLTEHQLKLRACPPSSLSLLGLVRHMTDKERGWFRHGFAGEDVAPVYYSDLRVDGDFDDVDSANAARDFDAYLAEVAACRKAVAGASLDDTFVRRRDGRQSSLRWVYLHMIEQYARHNGHADLLRERIDGVTGD